MYSLERLKLRIELEALEAKQKSQTLTEDEELRMNAIVIRLDDIRELLYTYRKEQELIAQILEVK